ncbi:unnamed protein product, partial [Anisakis simplex]|uniref:Microtubule-associated protein 2 n=1 Tax=Anisakis simplex TaxID=6269 RepID=A0A0M3JZU1_ANISI
EEPLRREEEFPAEPASFENVTYEIKEEAYTPKGEEEFGVRKVPEPTTRRERDTTTEEHVADREIDQEMPAATFVGTEFAEPLEGYEFKIWEGYASLEKPEMTTAAYDEKFKSKELIDEAPLQKEGKFPAEYAPAAHLEEYRFEAKEVDAAAGEQKSPEQKERTARQQAKFGSPDDEESYVKDSTFTSKIFGFAKKAGMVAGGVVAAPVALAAYDAVSKHKSQEAGKEEFCPDVETSLHDYSEQPTGQAQEREVEERSVESEDQGRKEKTLLHGYEEVVTTEQAAKNEGEIGYEATSFTPSREYECTSETKEEIYTPTSEKEFGVEKLPHPPTKREPLTTAKEQLAAHVFEQEITTEKFVGTEVAEPPEGYEFKTEAEVTSHEKPGITTATYDEKFETEEVVTEEPLRREEEFPAEPASFENVSYEIKEEAYPPTGKEEFGVQQIPEPTTGPERDTTTEEQVADRGIDQEMPAETFIGTEVVEPPEGCEFKTEAEFTSHEKPEITSAAYDEMFETEEVMAVESLLREEEFPAKPASFETVTYEVSGDISPAISEEEMGIQKAPEPLSKQEPDTTTEEGVADSITAQDMSGEKFIGTEVVEPPEVYELKTEAEVTSHEKPEITTAAYVEKFETEEVSTEVPLQREDKFPAEAASFETFTFEVKGEISPAISEEEFGVQKVPDPMTKHELRTTAEAQHPADVFGQDMIAEKFVGTEMTGPPEGYELKTEAEFISLEKPEITTAVYDERIQYEQVITEEPLRKVVEFHGEPASFETVNYDIKGEIYPAISEEEFGVQKVREPMTKPEFDTNAEERDAASVIDQEMSTEKFIGTGMAEPPEGNQFKTNEGYTSLEKPEITTAAYDENIEIEVITEEELRKEEEFHVEPASFETVTYEIKEEGYPPTGEEVFGVQQVPEPTSKQELDTTTKEGVAARVIDQEMSAKKFIGTEVAEPPEGYEFKTEADFPSHEKPEITTAAYDEKFETEEVVTEGPLQRGDKFPAEAASFESVTFDVKGEISPAISEVEFGLQKVPEPMTRHKLRTTAEAQHPTDVFEQNMIAENFVGTEVTEPPEGYELKTVAEFISLEKPEITTAVYDERIQYEQVITEEPLRKVEEFHAEPASFETVNYDVKGEISPAISEEEFGIQKVPEPMTKHELDTSIEEGVAASVIDQEMSAEKFIGTEVAEPPEEYEFIIKEGYASLEKPEITTAAYDEKFESEGLIDEAPLPKKEEFAAEYAPSGHVEEYSFETKEIDAAAEEQESAEQKERTARQQVKFGSPDDEESYVKDSTFTSKIFGFAKKAGVVAGGVVAAPVALAATGAIAAYDAASKHKGQEAEKQEFSPDVETCLHDYSEQPTGEDQITQAQEREVEEHSVESEDQGRKEKTLLHGYGEGVTTEQAPKKEGELDYEATSFSSSSEYEFTRETTEEIHCPTIEEEICADFEQEMTAEKLTGTVGEERSDEYGYNIKEEYTSLEERDVTIPAYGERFDVGLENVMSGISFYRDEELSAVPDSLPRNGEFGSAHCIMEEDSVLTVDVEVMGEKLPVSRTESVVEQFEIGTFSKCSFGEFRADSGSSKWQIGPEIDEKALSNVGMVGISDVESPTEVINAEKFSNMQQPLERQSYVKISSGGDDALHIAGGDFELLSSLSGRIAEEFSDHMVQDVFDSLGESIATGENEGSDINVPELLSSSENGSSFVNDDNRVLPKTSSVDAAHEHEVDYESDLKEKLDALATENKTAVLDGLQLIGMIRDDFIEEGSPEKLLNEMGIEEEVVQMIDEILKNVTETFSNSDSTYKTATSRDGYETCLTSQEDTFETAPGFLSQESEYTTATSGGESYLSEASEERRGSATPIAMVSPVQSDRHFTAAQDHEQELIVGRNLNVYFDSKTSTPEVPEIELAPVEDEEEPDEERIATSASGVLLIPEADPGRPISPIPPSVIEEEDQGIVIITNIDSSSTKQSTSWEGITNTESLFRFEEHAQESTWRSPSDQLSTESSFASIVESSKKGQVNESSGRQRDVKNYLGSGKDMKTSDESIHEKAMEIKKDFLKENSDVSLEDRTGGTEVEKIMEGAERTSPEISSDSSGNIQSDSLDSLDRISLKSGSSGKRYSTSRRSSNGSRKSSHDEPQMFVERLTPELKMTWSEAEQVEHSPKQGTPQLSPEVEYRGYSPEEEPVRSSEVELETVEEEPEDVDSLNGQSVSSNGQTTDSTVLGKYKHISSDNVSETSLQEFERIERDMLNKGESSLSGSELELYAATKLKASSADGSSSSLAEFERLEQEVGEGSPQEEVMMLSDIREESEVEDMSIRDDDEEEVDSIADIKSVPVVEENQVVTPVASPADSIEQGFEQVIPELLQTSTDSLEPIISGTIEIVTSKNERVFEEYELTEKITEDSLRDSLENIPHDRDSLLEGTSSQEMASQDTHGMLSGDTFQEYQEDERDSLSGDLDVMLGDYPTTLTTFETTQLNDNGCVQTISRRVLTRVKDPVISHVQFTGTENEARVCQLATEEEYETVDAEGNVTKTILHRRHPSSSNGNFSN